MNPRKKRVDDCAIRACALATGNTWDEVYDDTHKIGKHYKDMQNANSIWGEYLYDNGFRRKKPCAIMSVSDFCHAYPSGTYVLGLNGHVVTAINGCYMDTWDCGHKTVIYYWEREYGDK